MQFRHLAALLLSLCFCLTSAAQERSAQNLTVFAATSLTDVFEALREQFLAGNRCGLLLISPVIDLRAIDPGRAGVLRQRPRAPVQLVVESGILCNEARVSPQ